MIPRYDRDIEADIADIGTIKEANRITGGLSKPSRMPEASWNISAQRCQTGAKLRNVLGSTCRNCYALGSRYAFPAVLAAMERRWEGLHHELWTPAMALTIRKKRIRYMRLLDSGDLQSEAMFDNILQIAQAVRDTMFWVSSREQEFVRPFLGKIPDNLVVRMSATKVNGPPPKGFPHTSTVSVGQEGPGTSCVARQQGNQCLGCRACWSKEVGNVDYRLHP